MVAVGRFVVRSGLTASRHLSGFHRLQEQMEGMHDLRMRAALHAIFRDIWATAWEGGTGRCSLSALFPLPAKELRCGHGNAEARERCRMLGKSIDWLAVHLCVLALAPGPGNKIRLSAGGWGKAFSWLLGGSINPDAVSSALCLQAPIGVRSKAAAGFLGGLSLWTTSSRNHFITLAVVFASQSEVYSNTCDCQPMDPDFLPPSLPLAIAPDS